MTRTDPTTAPKGRIPKQFLYLGTWRHARYYAAEAEAMIVDRSTTWGDIRWMTQELAYIIERFAKDEAGDMLERAMKAKGTWRDRLIPVLAIYRERLE